MILDTNCLSAIADGDPALVGLLSGASDLAVPVIVLGEFKFGIRQSMHWKRYESWLIESIPYYRVLPVNIETAEHYAEIREHLKRSGRPIPANDLWIAALARQHTLPLLTRDKHFEAVPRLRLVNW